MASVAAPLPFQDAKATTTTLLSQVFSRRPRTLRTKTIALSVIALICFFFMLRSSPKVSADRFLLRHGHTAIVDTGTIADNLPSEPSLISGPSFPLVTLSPTGLKMPMSFYLPGPISMSIIPSPTIWTSPTPVYMSLSQPLRAHAVCAEHSPPP